MHWHFLWCKYLAATHINTKNEYEIKVWPKKKRHLIQKTCPSRQLLSIRNTKTRWETCSKLTIKTSEQCQWHRSGAFIDNFEPTSHFVSHILFQTFVHWAFAALRKNQKLDREFAKFAQVFQNLVGVIKRFGHVFVL